MNFTVLTIFPEMFIPFWGVGIVQRAIQGKKITCETLNIRDYADGKHRTTDDRPYGGGCGMVMKPEPLARAIQAARKKHPLSETILLTPQGKVFKQRAAFDFSRQEGLILVCGRYEGVDERIYENHIDHEISIGDYVLTGGEIASMVVIDAVTRLIPGVLGGETSAEKDTFSNGLIEHAHYTRPDNFEGEGVPDVLLSGHHERIETWRLETSLIRTFLKRKDLLAKKDLDKREIEILKKWCTEIEEIIRAQSLPGTDSSSGGQ